MSFLTITLIPNICLKDKWGPLAVPEKYILSIKKTYLNKALFALKLINIQKEADVKGWVVNFA